jgi:peptide-methionine (R)-S-oxide reductase
MADHSGREVKSRSTILLAMAAAGLAGAVACRALASSSARSEDEKKPASDKKGSTMTEKVVHTDEEWRKILTPEQYQVLRRKGTERAFTGALWNNHEKGIYVCAGCGLELFRSDTKFESGTGWPSFFAPITPQSVATEEDNSLFMRRTEVLCPRCGGHLGHVFDDGPPPTHLRYCMNSAALKFVKAP